MKSFQVTKVDTGGGLSTTASVGIGAAGLVGVGIMIALVVVATRKMLAKLRARHQADSKENANGVVDRCLLTSCT